jgi:hypothetical protein
MGSCFLICSLARPVFHAALTVISIAVVVHNTNHISGTSIDCNRKYCAPHAGAHFLVSESILLVERAGVFVAVRCRSNVNGVFAMRLWTVRYSEDCGVPKLGWEKFP